MKLLSSLLLLPCWQAAAHEQHSSMTTFRPTRISYQSLLHAHADLSFAESPQGDLMWEALTQVGMISITGIHNDQQQQVQLKDTLTFLHSCLMQMADTTTAQTSKASSSSKTTRIQHALLDDGTTRRLTLATHTHPGGIPQDISIRLPLDDAQVADAPAAVACDDFETSSVAFRQTVATVTEVFAQRLASLMQIKAGGVLSPLLSTTHGTTLDTIADVVQQGEHLEHFHSYTNNNQAAAGGSTSQEQDRQMTIDWHTDQGLFIVFTPGLLVQKSPVDSSSLALADGFVIQLPNGSPAAIEFDQQDDLVIMLGDGVNQLLQQQQQQRSSSSSSSFRSSTLTTTTTVTPLLRATPHALTMPWTAPYQSRVWYGRMVLPPAHALLHPAGEETTTFGHVRDMIGDRRQDHHDDGDTAAVRLGCSPASRARHLETTVCEQGTMRCWHRCMSLFPEDDVTTSLETTCASQGLDLVCRNPRGQVSQGEEHGDFYPGCLDLATAEDVTPFPSLPTVPRNDSVCSKDAFVEFYTNSNDETSYDHELDLGHDGAAIFKWSMNQDSGVVVGKLFYNGLFGYISIGIAKEGGEKNGMHGASVILALPGDNYNATTGLELGEDKVNVQEYVIHSTESAFRHWQTPVSSSSSSTADTTSTSRVVDNITSSYVVESTDCFTALRFQTRSIAAVPFNLTGTDILIWAVNTEDYFVSYHQARGNFSIHWPTGQGSLKHEHDDSTTTTTSDDQHKNDDQVEPMSGTNRPSATTALFGLSAAALIFAVAPFW